MEDIIMRKRKQTEWDIKQNLEWLEVADFSGFYYTCGLIHHNKKEISPCHGYYYPNPMATQMMKYAKKIGYKYVDCEMPSSKNKTLAN